MRRFFPTSNTFPNVNVEDPRAYVIGSSASYQEALDMVSVDFYVSNGWDVTVLYNHPFLDPNATVRENCNKHTEWIYDRAPDATGEFEAKNWKEHPYHKRNNPTGRGNPFPHDKPFMSRCQSGQIVQRVGRPNGIGKCLTCEEHNRECYNGMVKKGGKCVTSQGSQGVTEFMLRPTETPMLWKRDRRGNMRPAWRYEAQVRKAYWPLLRFFINDYRVAKLYEGGLFIDINNKAGKEMRKNIASSGDATQSLHPRLESIPSNVASPMTGLKRRFIEEEVDLVLPSKSPRLGSATYASRNNTADSEIETASQRSDFINQSPEITTSISQPASGNLNYQDLEAQYQVLANSPARLVLQGLPHFGLAAQSAINVAGDDHSKALQLVENTNDHEIALEIANMKSRFSSIEYGHIVSVLSDWATSSEINIARDTAIRLQAALNLSGLNSDLAKVYALLDGEEIFHEIARIKSLADTHGKINGIDQAFDEFEKEILVSKLLNASDSAKVIYNDFMVRLGFNGGIDFVYQHMRSMPDLLWMQLDSVATDSTV